MSVLGGEPRDPVPADATLASALSRLAATPAGLSQSEAAARLERFGHNRLSEDDGNHPLSVLARQFRSPLMLVLLAAAVLAFALGETQEGTIVAVIVFASTGLGFYQEYRAGNALAGLRRRIAVTAAVVRDGRTADLPGGEVVPGDIVMLTAGSLIVADAILLDAVALHIDEAALTGESFPVVKAAAALDAPLVADNRIHMGTSVRSGEGRALVVETGRNTAFGRIASSIAAEPETSFARGVRRFGLLMTQITFVLVTGVLVANVLLGRPVLDSVLFAAALAVGITPELLPAIVTVTLSQGARHLADRGVLVRRLVAIENLGAMDVLCTDKTGTLTAGDVQLSSALDPTGRESPNVLRWAMLNAANQTALPNPLDRAILARQGETDLGPFRRCGEVPYDFERKRLSIHVADGNQGTLVCKGAPANVLDACTDIEIDGIAVPLTADHRATEDARIADWGRQGLRALAVAIRPLDPSRACSLDDEAGLTLVGYLIFADPLKPGIAETVAALRHNGIQLKIVSGDNRHVAAHLAEAIGLHPAIVTGADLERLHDRAFARAIASASVFAEVAPDQKERIVAALAAAGHTVGYIGDGINDAPALRAADVGISVDNALDAAKASADVILLRQDLGVLLDGILAGRTAFGNTIKYITITISANFGNMVSMAVASVFLPFLPLLAGQVLLNNLLSDLPMLAISTDRVDTEQLAKPRRWDFPALIRSMVGFGLVSSVFDGLTFFVLLVPFAVHDSAFQTAWFIESLLTELVVVAVMRTQRPLFRSAPSTLLLSTSAGVAAFTLALPYLPFAGLVDLTPLPAPLFASVVGIVLAYAAATELLKAPLSRVRLPLPRRRPARHAASRGRR